MSRIHKKREKEKMVKKRDFKNMYSPAGDERKEKGEVGK